MKTNIQSLRRSGGETEVLCILATQRIGLRPVALDPSLELQDL